MYKKRFFKEKCEKEQSGFGEEQQHGRPPVKDGTIEKSAVYASWDGRFSKRDAACINEKNYARENGVNATFSRAFFDAGT